MLLWGLGIGMIIAGIVALATGKIKLTGTRAVQGVAARLIGVALLTPLPLGFFAAIVYTMTQVDATRPDQVDEWTRQNDATLTLIVAGVMIGTALLIILVAALLAKPIEAGRRRPADDDDYEDRRRRPRRDEREDEDDRPRRPRYDDDYDDRAR